MPKWTTGNNKTRSLFELTVEDMKYIFNIWACSDRSLSSKAYSGNITVKDLEELIEYILNIGFYSYKEYADSKYAKIDLETWANFTRSGYIWCNVGQHWTKSKCEPKTCAGLQAQSTQTVIEATRLAIQQEINKKVQ